MTYTLIRVPLLEEDSIAKFDIRLSKLVTPKLIICVANERYTISKLQAVIDVAKKYNFEKIVLLLDECLLYANLAFDNIDIRYLPYFELKTYNKIFNGGIQTINGTWNYQSKKALFLLGKPNKKNRIGLLYNFYKDNLLDLLNWSFHNKGLDLTQYLPSQLSDIEYQKFQTTVSKVLDPIHFQGTESMYYEGFPFDASLYSNTSLSIVSETECEDLYPTHFQTEKTFRAIVNKHPFIVAGDKNYLATLKEKGYRTFDSNSSLRYDTISNVEERMECVKLNVEYFIAQLDDPDFVYKVQEDITHNFLTFKERMSRVESEFLEEFKISSRLCTNFGL